MTRTCTICTHAQRAEIEAALVAGTPYRDIARRYGMSKDAVMRHASDHVAKQIAQAQEAREEAQALDVVRQLRAINAAAIAILAAARRTGEPEIALKEPGALVLIVAPVERQSGETFRKVVGVFHALGWPVPSTSLGTMHLQLANGSRVIALPGSGQTIRGYSGPRLLLLDEAAQIPDELLQAVFPML